MSCDRAHFERLRALNPAPTTELEFSSPYELLVAVALSAQSTDVGVNKATRKLFPVANTPAAIAALGVDGLKPYISTIGLYNVIDLRPQFLTELGMVNATVVEEMSGNENFSANLSAETKKGKHERKRQGLSDAVDDGAVLLAVCGGYQLAGHGYTGRDGSRMHPLGDEDPRPQTALAGGTGHRAPVVAVGRRHDPDRVHRSVQPPTTRVVHGAICSA